MPFTILPEHIITAGQILATLVSACIIAGTSWIIHRQNLDLLGRQGLQP